MFNTLANLIRSQLEIKIQEQKTQKDFLRVTYNKKSVDTLINILNNEISSSSKTPTENTKEALQASFELLSSNKSPETIKAESIFYVWKKNKDAGFYYALFTMIILDVLGFFLFFYLKKMSNE